MRPSLSIRRRRLPVDHIDCDDGFDFSLFPAPPPRRRDSLVREPHTAQNPDTAAGQAADEGSVLNMPQKLRSLQRWLHLSSDSPTDHSVPPQTLTASSGATVPAQEASFERYAHSKSLPPTPIKGPRREKDDSTSGLSRRCMSTIHLVHEPDASTPIFSQKRPTAMPVVSDKNRASGQVIAAPSAVPGFCELSGCPEPRTGSPTRAGRHEAPIARSNSLASEARSQAAPQLHRTSNSTHRDQGSNRSSRSRHSHGPQTSTWPQGQDRLLAELPTIHNRRTYCQDDYSARKELYHATPAKTNPPADPLDILQELGKIRAVLEDLLHMLHVQQ